MKRRLGGLLNRVLFDPRVSDPVRQRLGVALVAVFLVGFVLIVWPFIPIVINRVVIGIIDIVSWVPTVLSPPPPTAVPTASPSPSPFPR